MKRFALLAALGLLLAPWLFAQQKQHSVFVYIQPAPTNPVAIVQIDLYRNTSSSGPWDAAHLIGVVPLTQTTITCPAEAAPLTGQCFLFVDTKGVGGTVYFYAITAADAGGFESAAAVSSATTFPASPNTPNVPVAVSK